MQIHHWLFDERVTVERYGRWLSEESVIVGMQFAKGRESLLLDAASTTHMIQEVKHAAT